MIWCLNGHTWVWDYRTSTKSFAKITPKTYHFFNWPSCQAVVCVRGCVCMSVGVMVVLWTFPRWLSIHSLAHTHKGHMAISKSLHATTVIWLQQLHLQRLHLDRGGWWWQKDGENRAGRGQRCGGRDSAEGWYEKPFGVWSVFGEQMAWARGGACLVLATLHKSHSSPLRGSRVTVQWESMGITSREKRMNGRRGARPLPLLSPPSSCHSSRARVQTRVRSYKYTHAQQEEFRLNNRSPVKQFFSLARASTLDGHNERWEGRSLCWFLRFT